MKLKPQINPLKPLESSRENPNPFFDHAREKVLGYILSGAAVMIPNLVKADEGGHVEPQDVIENEGAVEFYNPKNVCPNPSLNEEGEPQFYVGFGMDVHGHVLRNKSDTGKDTGKNDCLTHPRVTLGASYTGTINIPSVEEEAHEEVPLNPNEEGLSEDEEGEHAVEDVGHLAHRFRLYLKFTLLNGAVDFGPVFGVGVGKGGENTQAILGGFVSAHPDRKHQHELSLSARTGIGKDGLAGFESGLFYHYNLTRNFNIGAHCIVEGHQGDRHWGCGPSLGVKYKGISLSAEVALGPGSQGVNTHTHLALMFDVMKFFRPNLPDSHGHPPH